MIISTHKGGISNRIKSLVSAMRYASTVNTNCGVLWKVLNDYNKDVHILNCDYNSLFYINNVSNVTENSEEYLYYDTLYCSDRLMIFENDNIPHNLNNFDSKCSKQFVCKDKFKRDIDYMYNKTPKNVINAYLPYFQKLKLIPELEVKINNFAAENFNEYTISMHIRSWNRNGENGRRNNLFDIDKFEKEIENKIEEYFAQNIDQYCNFFLTTDSQDVKDYFTNKCPYKDMIITYPRKTSLDNSRDFKEGVQEDAIELFLLGKNISFIGSHFSSYSEVAWWLAGCPNDVVIL